MIYTPMTNKAIKLMFKLHRDQTDRSGLPYVFHPWHVAESMDDEASTIVALLHDSVEDTEITLDELAEMGFSDEVIQALDLMTHRDGDDYFVYVRQLAHNPLARKVKLADLKHNSDIAVWKQLQTRILKEQRNTRKQSSIWKDFRIPSWIIWHATTRVSRPGELYGDPAEIKDVITWALARRLITSKGKLKMIPGAAELAT